VKAKRVKLVQLLVIFIFKFKFIRMLYLSVMEKICIAKCLSIL